MVYKQILNMSVYAKSDYVVMMRCVMFPENDNTRMGILSVKIFK